MVLGDVQSGKTGTYLGLFNKAADAGYRLIILLAGNTEALRQQTQARVDEAFIGRDSSRQLNRKGTDVTPRRFIGVGEIRRDLAQASGMTTVMRDFRKSSHEASNITIQTDAAHPYVFVLKKNKSVLTAVTSWLEAQATMAGGGIDVPVLLLDDESDYASVNTKDEDDPTAINKAVRDILGLFNRSSYVAFTATPFANIFIDHGVENDLFPKDYVYSLEAPSNYVGGLETFGTIDAVRSEGITEIEDMEDLLPLKHSSKDSLSELPSSLKEAVDSFFIANAIRDLRDQHDSTRSMLVNVSRFKHVQGTVFDLLEDEVSALRTSIELNVGVQGSQHPDLRRLKRTFERQFPTVNVQWQKVMSALPASVSDIRVQIFNSDKDRKLAQEDLTWDRPSRMIAVGGDVLSRGLTLEGLCVTYFHRSVTASDTLMQMGRWFGYRDGYRELCRLWINADAADNYRFAAESIEDLRADLRLMLRQRLTPADFGLAVRTHPEALIITARNKMKSAKSVSRVISLPGRRLETTTLDVSEMHAAASRNKEAMKVLLEEIERTARYEPTRRRWHRWQEVDKQTVADFLEQYVAADSDRFFFGNTLSSWARRAKASKYSTWDVVIARGGSPRTGKYGNGRTAPLTTRALTRDGDVVRVSASSRRLAGTTDLAGLVDAETEQEVTAAYKTENPDKGPPEREYYPYLHRPALILYLIDPTKARNEVREDLLALKVAIPGSTADVRNVDGQVEYVINTVAQQRWLTEFSDTEEDDLDE